MSVGDVPETVTAALADQQVEGQVCLEAGAGVGNTTAGLLAAGAKRVYAVTDDADHAATVRERVGDGNADRLAVVEADLRATPLGTGSVNLVTAHGLCNVLPPTALDAVAAELARVAKPDGHLVVDDYAVPPADGAVNRLFALENAAARAVDGRPALTFYPPAVLAAVFADHGWTVQRRKPLLDPVPWTEAHLNAHAVVVRGYADDLPDALGAPLTAMADDLVSAIGSERTGTMYSLAFRLAE
ncbi:class I SAM-dependent methyltransferase [Haloarcula sp. 1CSR25-25]|uniref:class I SAM-dependent methyltransferase n=1 Tax=Haloarcula sp. 1CSR25-25 TaxID=2862545 RepID=UPI00289489CC|nr:class I SAM-dependent methyltransferase [Haloarcula sp. 1CSR25-25]MDT3433396.1 class I SAM-dependent methyltransferase [Haloarcula sp. 1CSR25-25]